MKPDECEDSRPDERYTQPPEKKNGDGDIVFDETDILEFVGNLCKQILNRTNHLLKLPTKLYLWCFLRLRLWSYDKGLIKERLFYQLRPYLQVARANEDKYLFHVLVLTLQKFIDDLKPLPASTEDEKKVVAPNPKVKAVTLYSKEKNAYVEYTEADLFGLVTGDKEVLEKFGYSADDEKYLNKGLFASMLGEFGTLEAQGYLEKLLLYPFPDDPSWESNYFSAVSAAAWEIRHTFSNREQVIELFIKALQEGGYAAKVAACDQASYMLERAFLKPLKELVYSTKDQRLQKFARRKLEGLRLRIQHGEKEIDPRTYPIERI